MLVLSRQRDETIMIGDEIEITVVDIRGDKVRLGITAPTKIAVHRKEVYEAIKAENQRAAQLNGGDLSVLKSASIPPGGKARPRPSGLSQFAPPSSPTLGPTSIKPPTSKPTGLPKPGEQTGGAQTA
jgi:carbon storage regulator